MGRVLLLSAMLTLASAIWKCPKCSEMLPWNPLCSWNPGNMRRTCRICGFALPSSAQIKAQERLKAAGYKIQVVEPRTPAWVLGKDKRLRDAFVTLKEAQKKRAPTKI